MTLITYNLIKSANHINMLNILNTNNNNNIYYKYNNKINILQNEIIELKKTMQTQINEMQSQINELYKLVNYMHMREEEQKQDLTCCVCMTEKKTHANMNCCHLCVCEKCCYSLNNKCPLCRTIGVFKKIII